MAIQDEAAAILKSALEPQSDVPSAEAEVIAESASTPPQKVAPAEPAQSIPTEQDDVLAEAAASPFAPPQTSKNIDPVEVAGLGKWVGKAAKAISEKADEAAKRSYPQTGDKILQLIDPETIVIKPMSQADYDKFTAGFTKILSGAPDAAPPTKEGLKFERVAEAAGEYEFAAIMRQAQEQYKDLFDQAKRGSVSVEEVIKKVREKDINKLVYQWARRQPGKASNAEDVVGGVLATIHSYTAARQAAFDAMTAGTEASSARALGFMNLFMKVSTNASGGVSESARGVNMAGQLQKLKTASDVFSISRDLSNMSAGLDMTNPQSFVVLGQYFLSMKDPNQAGKFLEKSKKAKTIDFLNEAWINTLLSGIPTHMVNIGGNAIFMATRVLEEAAAGGVGRARVSIGNIRQKLGGEPPVPERAHVREALVGTNALVGALGDSLLIALKTYAKGEGLDLTSKLDIPKRAIGTTDNPVVMAGMYKKAYESFLNGDILNTIKNIGEGTVNLWGIYNRSAGRALNAEDQMFKVLNYRYALRREAEIQAHRIYESSIDNGMSKTDALAQSQAAVDRIMANPPPGISETAQKFALEGAFQQPLKGGFAYVSKLIDEHPLSRTIIPFVKTAVNIMKAIYERTPLPLVNPVNESIREAIRAGGREADVALTKIAVGSTTIGLMAYNMTNFQDQNGDIVINGYGPYNPKERKAWLLKFKPYTISFKTKTGDYTHVSYDRFDPLSVMIGMAADYAYIATHTKDQSVLSALAMNAVVPFQHYALELPMLEGPAKFLQALDARDLSKSSENVAKLLLELAPKYLSSPLPLSGGMGRAISRYMDPTAKSRKIPPVGILGQDPSALHEVIQSFYTGLQDVKATIPYFNSSLPPRLNVWGEEMQAGQGNMFDLFSPVKVIKSGNNEINSELIRLGRNVAEFPAKREGITLNALQYNKWIELTNSRDAAGRYKIKNPDGSYYTEDGFDPRTTLLNKLRTLVTEDWYKKLPDHSPPHVPGLDQVVQSKSNEIRKVLAEYRRDAWKRLLQTDEGSDLADKIRLLGKGK